MLIVTLNSHQDRKPKWNRPHSRYQGDLNLVRANLDLVADENPLQIVFPNGESRVVTVSEVLGLVIPESQHHVIRVEFDIPNQTVQFHSLGLLGAVQDTISIYRVRVPELEERILP